MGYLKSCAKPDWMYLVCWHHWCHWCWWSLNLGCRLSAISSWSGLSVFPPPAPCPISSPSLVSPHFSSAVVKEEFVAVNFWCKGSGLLQAKHSRRCAAQLLQFGSWSSFLLWDWAQLPSMQHPPPCILVQEGLHEGMRKKIILCFFLYLESNWLAYWTVRRFFHCNNQTLLFGWLFY